MSQITRSTFVSCVNVKLILYLQTFANSLRARQQGVPTLTFPVAPKHTCEKCIRVRGWRHRIKDDTKS